MPGYPISIGLQYHIFQICNAMHETDFCLLQAEKLVFISAMAALEHGNGESLEEMDISALYEAALEEAEGIVADDVAIVEVEDAGASASYAQQLTEEL